MKIRSSPSDTKVDFFSTLGRLSARHHPEDQLSNTFCACFNFSVAFRESILKLLWKRCHLVGSIPQANLWECVTQIVHKNRFGVCRHDILLRPIDNATPSPKRIVTFILESKLRARLIKDQLSKYLKLYRGRPDQYRLVAITKRYPDIPISWLTAKGISCIRWQDIYRQLTFKSHSPAQDKLIIASFLTYLEECDMAYGEVSLSDLKNIGTMFRSIGRHSKEIGRVRFAPAVHCIEMLAEIQRNIKDSSSGLSEWHSWGPGYYFEDSDEEDTWHCLGFGFWKKNTRQSLSIYIGLAFREDKTPDTRFYAHFWNDKTNDYHKPQECWSRVHNFQNRDTNIDREKIISTALSIVKKWGLQEA